MKLSWLNGELFEGVKFHEKETPWFRSRRNELRKVLDRIAEQNKPVQFHTGDDEGCRPLDLVCLAKTYPTLKFDFAHCKLAHQSALAVAECPNVYVDTAFFDADFFMLRDYDWQGRLMYGSDLPVWQAHRDVPLTKYYRKNLEAFNRVFPSADGAFIEFLTGNR